MLCNALRSLRATLAGAKGADAVLIHTNIDLFLRWLFVRATHFSERGNRCGYTATGGGRGVTPIDLGFS